MIKRLWQWLRQTASLLMLARFPILMVVAGLILAAWVAQVRELFDISLDHWPWAFWAFVFTAGLSLLVWYSARTLYSFHWPRPDDSTDVQQWLGERLPRLLATSGPLIMAGAYFQAQGPDNDPVRIFWILAYLTLAVSIWLLTTYRRTLIGKLERTRKFSGAAVDDWPKVGLLRNWHELGWSRHLHHAGLIALPVSWLVGLYFSSTIDVFGPMALILGAAAFTVWASTPLVYLAARLRFPLVTALIAWASLMTVLGWNDNHAVRLTHTQTSDQLPPPNLHYAPANQPGLGEFMNRWWQQRRTECDDQIWLVSSEGGGIRAAMWTVLVLSELHNSSEGRMWSCTLAASGVSGGSLGLAVFASAYRDHHGQFDQSLEDGLVRMLETDFLAPVLGALFGVDGVQRFVPFRLFSDRGQALEDAWLRAYDEELGGQSLRGPLADTIDSLDGTRLLPALFLNATVVDSGQRLIQHPLRTLHSDDSPYAFPGAIDGTEWLPRELPTFSAAHNSARFTIISPAGTVRRRHDSGDVKTLGQLVDGGYFENSATTTVTALIAQVRTIAPEARLRVIHISNDPDVPSFAPDGHDQCDHSTERLEPSARSLGELRAPLVAILATRQARGEYARRSVMEQLAGIDHSEMRHYRLCHGDRRLPLGWTVSPASTREMRQQLQAQAQLIKANTVAD